MRQRWSTASGRGSLLLVLVVALLLGLSPGEPHRSPPPIGVQRLTSGLGRCPVASPLATALWVDPVSGAEFTATLDGYFRGGHFCGQLAASATLTGSQPTFEMCIKSGILQQLPWKRIRGSSGWRSGVSRTTSAGAILADEGLAVKPLYALLYAD